MMRTLPAKHSPVDGQRLESITDVSWTRYGAGHLPFSPSVLVKPGVLA